MFPILLDDNLINNIIEVQMENETHEVHNALQLLYLVFVRIKEKLIKNS